ncbi:MAG: ABC transporter permease subunit [Streptomycetaceae bacterium]|nr:MAG: ABC transporter permease subunit [Streptomycetaceae bacterium]
MSGLIRGNFAFMGKVALLAIVTAMLALLTEHAFVQKEYAIGSFLLFAILALNFTYLTKFSIPLKFFVPGILFFIAFVIAPIIFTLSMSTYHYQTGNILGKGEATQQVVTLGAEPDENGTTFDINVGETPSGDFAILVSDIANNKFFISTKDTRTEVPASGVTLDENGVATAAPGFTLISAEMLSKSDDYSRIHYKYQDKFYIGIEGQNVGAVFQQSLTYDKAAGVIKNVVTGDTYKDNGRGNWAKVGAPDEMLTPGWRAPIWFENYTKLVSDEKVRTPLIKVFIWTVVFAGMSVLTTFALGLLLAMALNRKIRGRRIYRSILILPYAMPSVMSILIWAGMFDTEFGAINNLLHTHIAWFTDANFARGAVLLVNLWLGFPYFYLICSGSLQAIPTELQEAAAIDGANPRQIFRKITLPLLLQILSPLLIASFAFNFNNFNLIYLLTGGGPRETLDGQIAGATDILISYTYQIAFGNNTQDFGLASAISVLIFVLVASISLYGLKKSKVMETFG